jgi:hypothetical protein
MPNKAKPLPSLDYIREALCYNELTGVFIWKERPMEHFRLEREWKRWNSTRPGKVAGARQFTTRGSRSKITIKLDNASLPAHRVAWALLYGEPPEDSLIDHVNGDPFDNRRENFRLADNTKNQWNRTHPKNSTHGIKGVTWAAQQSKWKGSIRANKQYYHIGYFSTKGLAATAVAKASLRIHGTFSPFYRKAA